MTIRVGNCSGYYGDRISAMREMLEGGELDYLTGDYLAELTMLILGRDQLKDANLGYARTFLRQVTDCLALAKEIVHLHGGSIRVASEIGAGSCFTVELPLGLVPAPKPDVSIERLLVLLVDDNPVNLIALCDYLEHNGCRVEMAENGAIALEKTQALRPDIVLMDVQMPVMDGLEAMRRIRALPDPFFAELPILAVTALTVSGDRELCLNAGANDYMGKPVSPKAVWVRVQALTAGRGGRPSTRLTP